MHKFGRPIFRALEHMYDHHFACVYYNTTTLCQSSFTIVKTKYTSNNIIYVYLILHLIQQPQTSIKKGQQGREREKESETESPYYVLSILNTHTHCPSILKHIVLFGYVIISFPFGPWIFICLWFSGSSLFYICYGACFMVVLLWPNCVCFGGKNHFIEIKIGVCVCGGAHELKQMPKMCRISKETVYGVDRWLQFRINKYVRTLILVHIL